MEPLAVPGIALALVRQHVAAGGHVGVKLGVQRLRGRVRHHIGSQLVVPLHEAYLLYTFDVADDMRCVDHGGLSLIKNKTHKTDERRHPLLPHHDV